MSLEHGGASQCVELGCGGDPGRPDSADKGGSLAILLVAVRRSSVSLWNGYQSLSTSTM